MFDKAKKMWELQSKAKAIQNELKSMEFTAEELGGKVTVTVNGEQKVVGIDIAEELLTPTEKEAVERFVRQATNAALSKAQQEAAGKMKAIAGELGLGI